MISKLIEKQKVIDYFRSMSPKDKPYCVNELWWKIYDIEGARLTVSPKKETIRSDDLVEFIKSRFNDEEIYNPGVIADAIEAEYKDAEPQTAEDGFCTGYNLAYSEIKELIPEGVYDKVRTEYADNQWFGDSTVLRGCIEELVEIAGVADVVWIPGHYEEKEG